VPPPSISGINVDARAVRALDDAGLAILLVDDGGVVLADQVVAVQLVECAEIGQRVVLAAVVDGRVHDCVLVHQTPFGSALRGCARLAADPRRTSAFGHPGAG
jgi:hypothetical protein